MTLTCTMTNRGILQEKFIRRVAEKLETGSIALTKAIADITSQLEEYRLKQLDKQETRKEKAFTRSEIYEIFGAERP